MLEAIVGVLGTAMLAIFGWAFNLSNRVGLLEKGEEGLDKLLDAKFSGLKEVIEAKFDATDQRLARIERSMNGHLIRD